MTPADMDPIALVDRIPTEWLEPTRSIARALAARGRRAWIVGGAVRDLLLGREIHDIDLVSAARPEEVEALFDKTVAVGRSFGIVVVVVAGKEIEVATFRKERGYSDRRRPDEIEFAETPEVDAGRRDFTCNALFLDPLTGEIADPAGGLADLERGELAAVGEAAGRFREDGLRLLRLARFLAALELGPAEGLLEAAHAEREAIVGVSPERVLDELLKIVRGPHAARALATLEGIGVAALCLPGWSSEEANARVRALELAAHASPEVQLAVVLGGTASLASDRLERLRASKDLRRVVAEIEDVAAELMRWTDAPPEPSPLAIGARVELRRLSSFTDGLALARARHGDSARIRGVEALADELNELDRRAPAQPEVPSAAQVMAAGLPAGPALGDALRRLRWAALGGAYEGVSGGLDWLRGQGDVSS